MMLLKFGVIFPSIMLYATVAMAQTGICQTWYTDGKESAVEIYRGEDGIYYGKIVWLKNGYTNGKPLIDTKNPDKSKRSKEWLGLQIISGLQKKSETEYVSGKIYDPSKGDYYDCKMTLVNSRTLELRGYILDIPFLGRTTTWTLKQPDKQPAPSQQIDNPTPNYLNN